MERRPRQHIHYLRTADGVQLAWADASTGPLLIKAANWLTHLEYEWESPVWGHWLRFFSSHFRLVRYDERGCGMGRATRSATPWAPAADARASEAAQAGALSRRIAVAEEWHVDPDGAWRRRERAGSLGPGW